MYSSNIHSLSQHKTRKICIYGCGLWGRKCLQLLRDQGVVVDFFCDQNPALVGTYVAGHYCLSLPELICRKEEVLLILAVKQDAKLRQELADLGVPFVIPFLTLSAWVAEHPSDFYLIQQEHYGKISYQEEATQAQMAVFRQLLLEMERYYQGLGEV